MCIRDSNYLVFEEGGEICDLGAAGKGVVNLEDRVLSHLLDGAEGERVGAVFRLGRAGNDPHIAFNFIEKIRKGDELTVHAALIRKLPLDFDVGGRIAQRQCGAPAAQIGNRRTIQVMGMRSRKEDLMIVLRDVLLVCKYQRRDDRPDLKRTLIIEVRDIAHDHKIAVETDRVPLLDQALDVLVMTDQFLKH